MSGDDHVAPPTPSDDDGQGTSLRHRLKPLALLTPWGINRRIQSAEKRIEIAFDRLDAIEGTIRVLQQELSEIRDDRLGPAEGRIDNLERALAEVSAETGRLRDGVIPASVARSDALLERLAEEIEETSSLVERVMRKEPLPLPAAGAPQEERLAAALAEVQPHLLEAFRGNSEEIAHRLDRYLDDLRSAAPVLDLGCGRGELLNLLREAGVAATGVEGDSALVGAAVRRGLTVLEGDVLDVLRRLDDGAWGAVTAIHLFEHLMPGALVNLLSEVQRVLRPGGLLIVECPNPHSLRVGASLFWQDPTHIRPLLPETLELFLKTSGFELTRLEVMHPFPAEQLLANDDDGSYSVTDADLTTLAERIDRLRVRLDEILSAPRDFAVWAKKPLEGEA